MDPLIKSQLLYQLSYAPGLPRREPPQRAWLSKGGRVSPAFASDQIVLVQNGLDILEGVSSECRDLRRSIRQSDRTDRAARKMSYGGQI